LAALALEPVADNGFGLSPDIAIDPFAIDICGVDEVASVALISL
jgi:hypothetical protein